MPQIKWTLEKLTEEAGKYEYLSDFAKNSWNACCAARRWGVIKEVTKNLLRERTFWTEEMLVSKALRHNTRTDFRKNEPSAYECARIRGLLDNICGHMISTDILLSKPRPKSVKWTLEKLTEEALKHNTKSEFKAAGNGAYQAARKRKLLNLICSHMVCNKKIWTEEEIYEAALLFNTRQDFKKGNHKAYEQAHRKGIINKVCKHMKLTTRISNMERELFDAIKEVYIEAKTLYDHKVKIQGKSHIKRFEIDIFVRSLMKGIEFDGIYYHSFAGLRRNRKHWPIDDVVNYHEIKDAWFSTKGIKILHIKEEDWKMDKQSCIQKCLDFLIG